MLRVQPLLFLSRPFQGGGNMCYLYIFLLVVHTVSCLLVSVRMFCRSMTSSIFVWLIWLCFVWLQCTLLAVILYFFLGFWLVWIFCSLLTLCDFISAVYLFNSFSKPFLHRLGLYSIFQSSSKCIFGKTVVVIFPKNVNF